MSRFAKGEKAIVLATDYGVTKSRIYDICKGIKRPKPKKTGPTKPKPRPKPLLYTPEEQMLRAEILEKYTQGASPTELSKEYEIPLLTICTICSDAYKPQ